jgi:hypothetical protein
VTKNEVVRVDDVRRMAQIIDKFGLNVSGQTALVATIRQNVVVSIHADFFGKVVIVY